MSNINRDGVNIYYDTYGNKKNKALLFITGAALDNTIWQAQIDALKDSFYIIAPDLRGCGKSDRPEYGYPVSLLCEDMEHILAEEGIDSLYVAGFSLGGLVAQMLYARNPVCVEKLALLNCTLGTGNPDIRLPEQEVTNMYIYCGALSDEDLTLNVLDFCFGTDLKESDPDFYKAYYNKTIKNVGGIPFQIKSILDKTPLIPDYEMVTIPVLYVYSLHDVVTPTENADTVKEYIPHARIVAVDGQHMSVMQQAEQVNDAFRDFFKVYG